MLPFSIDLKPGEPAHEQILAAAREALASGQLRDGDLFPLARALAQELRISPSAASKVVKHLREEGLLAEQRGSTLMVRFSPTSLPVETDALAEMATVVIPPERMGGESAGAYPFLSPAPKQASESGDVPLGMIAGYEVIRRIGQGGMGQIFEALDRGLMRKVAVKVLAPQLAASAEARARFLREARAAAAVDHESVLPIHAVGESGGFPYLVMPLVAGGSLQTRIDNEGRLSISEICRIAMKVASGLAAAHERGLMHRDIKPDNILLEEQGGRVWIADFGLARAAEEEGLTVTGVIAATPLYASPEQALGEGVDQRTDLFSLGSVMYAMAVGSPPFSVGSALAIFRKIAEEATPDLREERPELPEKLVGLILKLLSKKPEERPKSVRDVAEFLERM